MSKPNYAVHPSANAADALVPGAGSRAQQAAAASTWAVAVIANRETLATLQRTVEALCAAVADHKVVIDLVVNGNSALAEAAAQCFAACSGQRTAGCRLRVWELALGDKAHALNEYLHTVWPGAPITFFVDGYVRVRPDALARLHDLLALRVDALAAAAVPSVGRSAPAQAADMLADGGLHGNLFALRRATVLTMRERGFRLPVGLYRTDSTMGAALSLGLSPAHHQWNARGFIAVDGAATWDIDLLPWWRPSMLQANTRRRLRQAQGEIENWAVRHWLLMLRRSPETLQGTVQQLVATWAELDPQGLSTRLAWHPLRHLAMRKLRRPADWSLTGRPPRLLLDG